MSLCYDVSGSKLKINVYNPEDDNNVDGDGDPSEVDYEALL